ncbi:hypothetical protein KIM322_12580 [Lactobacillus xylocopicola]|uniref:Uncharacterized protein n=1 Tax=Lactobacillus xylocopicola TaxID=2976676 RepID=A0ABM8BI73_9LACO|nr:hypothetical protein KIM322_12580 [Lactobacillus xylocopicola]
MKRIKQYIIIIISKVGSWCYDEKNDYYLDYKGCTLFFKAQAKEYLRSTQVYYRVGFWPLEE